ncbi:hypothetical protein TIFTF001_019096 [Ficus carica]|uniref:Protein kinase domain-containing protein n=1 Tax=Ficus carica TaxID=3494 RepID=A0AA88ACC6_FICCA|nr:hypothetical protein TIFTF001_019096 [Ficus carica]
MWWALVSTILLSLIVDARPEKATLSNVSGHVLLAEGEPISHVSPMDVQSPGKAEVKLVHHQDLNKRILIALVVASTVLGGLLLFLSCLWIYRQKKLRDSDGKNRKKMEEAAKGEPSSSVVVRFNTSRMGSRSSVAIFDYELLETATNKFSQSNDLGESGSGHVYKAHFDEKLLATVKKLDDVALDVERKFDNELNWLSQIRQQNIIKLLGPTQGSALTWHLRLKIAVDVARGLEYLHEHCNPPLVHRDLQLSNILLDFNFNAKISNFGLAVTSGTENKDNIGLSGTSAYVAPEYILDGKLTDKSDVYAFGVVLLELLMGRKLVENKASVESQSLVKWAMPQLTDRTRLPIVVDHVIRDTMDLRHLYQVAAVAVLCVQPEPSYRPLITDVLHSLIPLVTAELGGSLRVTEPVPSACAEPSGD